jgi:hypothetical protein
VAYLATAIDQIDTVEVGALEDNVEGPMPARGGFDMDMT